MLKRADLLDGNLLLCHSVKSRAYHSIRPFSNVVEVHVPRSDIKRVAPNVGVCHDASAVSTCASCSVRARAFVCVCVCASVGTLLRDCNLGLSGLFSINLNENEKEKKKEEGKRKKKRNEIKYPSGGHAESTG